MSFTNVKIELFPKGRDSYRDPNMKNNSSSGPDSINDPKKTDRTKTIKQVNNPKKKHNSEFEKTDTTEEKNESAQNDENPSDVEKTQNDKKTQYITFKNVIIIFSLIVCGVAIFIQQSYDSKKQVSIEGLKQIFPNESADTFDNFETIINEIVYERAVYPAVFLFLYNTNEKEVNKLVEHLATYASQKLESIGNYIDVHTNEFHTKEAINDYGTLIEKYKTDIIEKKVMLVKNLQNIPGETAQIFHSFCDEISPLVERVAYIFTLKVDSLNGKPEKIADINLKRVWNDLEIDVLMPLITRVTSTVLKI